MLQKKSSVRISQYRIDPANTSLNHDMIIDIMSRTRFFLFFLVIIVAAIFLRFYRLGQIPFSLYWDEAAILVDVKSVVQTGLDMHNRPWYQVIYPSYGDFKLPVYIWFATLNAKIFGVTEFALRLPSALAGIGTIIVGGFIARELVSRSSKSKIFIDQAHLFTMAVIALIPWSIMFSRTGFEGHVGQFFLALSVLCMLWSKKKPWLMYLAPVFGVVATYTYFSVRFVWFIILGVVGVFLLLPSLKETYKKKEHKVFIWQVFQKLILPTIIFIVLLIPMLKSPLYEDTNRFRLGTDSVLKNDKQVIDSNVYREMAGDSRLDRVIFHRIWLTSQQLFKNYSDNISLNFMFVNGDPNLRHGTHRAGLFYLFFLPFFIAGLYYFFQKDKAVLTVLIAWWLIALLPASVPTNTPHALRSLNALVPLAILVGVGVVAGMNGVKKFFTPISPFLSKLVTPLVILIIIISAVSFSFHYFTVYPSESAVDWQDGYKELAQTIYANKSDLPVYVLPFDDRFYLWLMAYGPHTGQDFHTWKSRDYKFQDFGFDHIFFTEPTKDAFSSGNPARIAGRIDQVDQVNKDLSLTVLNTQNIPGGDGSTQFVLEEAKQQKL